ncbi:MAG: hypothetical protein HY736_15730 [Verrucomicrobia bacterium]|nr:hypothetical protein [Verrucomicrobiota bacterium]
MKLVRYLANLDRRRFTLWSAFLWYAAIAIRHADGDYAAWLRSLGIAAIVGSILMLNATPPNGRWRNLEFWPAFRLFLIPFCVSSFASLAKGRDFFLIFPLNATDNLVAAGVIALFASAVAVARALSPGSVSRRRDASANAIPHP